MRRISPILAVVVGFAAGGCATRSDASPPTASALASAEPPARAPIVVRVDGPAEVRPGSELALRIVIERAMGGDPLDIRVMLPEGTDLVSGRTQEQITGGSKHVERSLVLRLSGDVPAADLRVTVDMRGTGYGVHATSAYRFGRPEPKLPQPPRQGRPVVIHGQNAGSPIPLGR
jgi:hypothetical protein